MPQAKQYAYFPGDATATLFETDTCENCGKTTAVNLIKTTATEGRSAIAAGLASRAERLPPEGYYSPELECEVCERCDPDNIPAARSADERMELLRGIEVRLRLLGAATPAREAILSIIKLVTEAHWWDSTATA